jgi:hypothetical protein
MAADQDLQLDIGHVLLIDVVGYSRRLIHEQREALRTLNQVVRQTGCFREVAADRRARSGTRCVRSRLIKLVQRPEPQTIH